MTGISMQRRFLNVGGGSKLTPVPPVYDGWEHFLLDIDTKGEPEICLDARELATLEAGRFDAVYCSHNLEHYFAHDVKRVLAGFHHVLKDDGFAEIRVPDMGGLFQEVIERKLDIDDVLYQSPLGPIMVRDVIYGLGKEIEQSGVDFYAHKTGFTRKSITAALNGSNFPYLVFTTGRNREIAVRAFKKMPNLEQRALLGIKV
jgi:SAM-dependent methyltransferase